MGILKLSGSGLKEKTFPNRQERCLGFESRKFILPVALALQQQLCLLLFLCCPLPRW